MTRALPPIDAVAFDLDGTLVDSAADIRVALNAALADAGLAQHDFASVRAWIGDGPDALIERALAHQGIGPGDAGLRMRLRRGFDAATLQTPLGEGSVFPGVAAMLDRLRGTLALTVVTNKPTPLARAVLDAAGLLSHFIGVHGADTPARRKPAPALLQDAAAQAGVAPERLLMVGDSALDLRSAGAAGCPAVLVEWGYGHDALPAGLDAMRATSPAQLLRIVLAARAACEPIANF